MKQKYLYILFLLVGLAASSSVQAVKNYSCDFENQADRDRWQLNPTATTQQASLLKNKWYIGSPGNRDKNGHGLYISDDGGASAHYSSNACWVIAYDTISLDKLSSGDYTLAFDYCGMGNVDNKLDGIYLLWAPVVDSKGDSVKIMSNSTFAGVPSAYENYIIQLQPKAGMDYVGGTLTWKPWVATIPNKKCDGTPHILAFVWANTSSAEIQPGGMIDNIEIFDSRPCETPTDLTLSIQGTTSILTWNGSETTYEVSAYSYEDTTWYGPKIVNAHTASFNNLTIGQTDFVVRAKCADDLFSLKTSITKLVYYPDQMCIDYLDLEKASCYVAKLSGSDRTDSFNNFTKINKPEDHGPGSIESRHTVHFDKTELEPITGYQIKTIPEGELASVRLGNWNNGAEAERIEFSFKVDTIAYPVLLLKYLPILEAPNHPSHVNSRFLLDILVDNHTLGECVQADFNCNDVYNPSKFELLPGAAEQGWHLTPPEIACVRTGRSSSTNYVVWKDWTPVGVNLKDPKYQGKKLTVRITSFDCTASGHCGYVYFTLGCSDGNFKGMKCGAINPTFEAPDGFVYRWALASSEQYRLPDGTIPEQYVLGHGQTFEAGLKDDNLYVVDCMFVQDSACFFSLYASTLATNPIAVIEKNPKITKSCQEGKYRVQFDGSNSWVQEIDHVTNDTAPSQIHHIDRFEWTVEGITGGWSDEKMPTFDFPSAGGDFEVKLTVISGICDSSFTYHLHLDELKETRDTMTVVLCDDVRKTTGYTWDETGKTYFNYGLDYINIYNPVTSCDSFLYLNLIEPVRVPVEKVVLPENLPFTYRGRKYYESTIDTIPNMSCDTTWILNMTVYDNLKVEMPDTFKLCGNDNALTLQYKITQGFSKGYTYGFTDSSLPTDTVDTLLLFGEHEIVIPLDPKPRPNQYEGSLKLFDSIPWWSVTLPFKLIVRYDSAIVEQKWNDVLYVLAPGYNNGDNEGYEFTAFQWYRNDTLLEGETRSYLYQPLDFKSEYYVELTRADDGVVMASCPITPTNRQQKTDYPSIINMQSSASPGQRIQVRLSQPAKIWFYSVSGQIYAAYTLSEGDSTITAPLQRGMYIVKMMDEQGEVKAQRLLVQ